MSRADRVVRRASRHLGPGETLLASASGYEHEGRRRQVVLLTDRRVLVAGLRSEQPLELAFGATAAVHEPDHARLTLLGGGQPRAVLRDVEAAPAAQIAAMLGGRRLPDGARVPRAQHDHRRPSGSAP